MLSQISTPAALPAEPKDQFRKEVQVPDCGIESSASSEQKRGRDAQKHSDSNGYDEPVTPGDINEMDEMLDQLSERLNSFDEKATPLGTKFETSDKQYRNAALLLTYFITDYLPSFRVMREKYFPSSTITTSNSQIEKETIGQTSTSNASLEENQTKSPSLDESVAQENEKSPAQTSSDINVNLSNDKKYTTEKEDFHSRVIRSLFDGFLKFLSSQPILTPMHVYPLFQIAQQTCAKELGSAVRNAGLVEQVLSDMHQSLKNQVCLLSAFGGSETLLMELIRDLNIEDMI